MILICGSRYRVKCIAEDKTARTYKFSLEKDGTSRDVSVEEYYRETYKNKDGTPMQLKHPNFPLVECDTFRRVRKDSKGNGPVYVPMELLNVVPGQKRARQLPGRSQASMIKMMSQKPQDRLKMTKQRFDESQIATSTLVRDVFKIQIEDDMIETDCRILDEREIEMG